MNELKENLVEGFNFDLPKNSNNVIKVIGIGGGGGGIGSQQADGIGFGGTGCLTNGENGDPEGDGTPTAGSGGPHTGGGGGGTGRTTGSPNPVSGAGGSGIVIIRYRTTTEQEPDILYPGTGGKTELPGTAGILALREYRPSGQQYSITRTAGYNLPYSYEWSGMTNEHSDKNYLYTTVSSTSILNTDFIISLWCYLRPGM